MGTWLNGDGLYIKYGTTRATVANGGEYNVFGGQHVAEFDITLSTLTATSAIINDVVWMPDNVMVDKVEVVATTAAASAGSGTLNVGLVDSDRSTVADADGLVVTLALTAIDAAGETSVLTEGVSGHGALVGTNLTAGPYLFCADYDTAAYESGVVKVRVFYHFIA